MLDWLPDPSWLVTSLWSLCDWFTSDPTGPALAFFFGGCPCCGIKVGFDGISNAMPVSTCYPSATILSSLALDVSRIGECKVVFCGTGRECYCTTSTFNGSGPAINFASGDWPAVKTYIENGGRLVLLLNDDLCVTDETTVDSFLAAMGSTMTYDRGQYDCSSCAGMVAGVANIGSGLTTGYRGAGQISGGTSVFLQSGARGLMQVEALGNGFLFVAGDYDGIAGFCSGGVFSCDLITRLIEYADADII